jgi:hypothetical protein
MTGEGWGEVELKRKIIDFKSLSPPPGPPPSRGRRKI